MLAERRGPAVRQRRNASDHMEGRGDLTMATISPQDLQRRLYDEAKAEKW